MVRSLVSYNIFQLQSDLCLIKFICGLVLPGAMLLYNFYNHLHEHHLTSLIVSVSVKLIIFLTSVVICVGMNAIAGH